MRDGWKPERVRILCSYHYFKDINMEQWIRDTFSEPYPEVFADSGAFSAWTQGSEIRVQDYAEWLHKWDHVFSVRAGLDVIGDANGTWENQQFLDAEGLDTIPVFHTGEDWEWLKKYVGRYPYIGLGGMVGKNAKKLMPWLVRCFKIAGDEAVFHGFGMTSYEVAAVLPFYTVDSSSWSGGVRWARVNVFDDRTRRFVGLKAGDARQAYRYSELIRHYGFDPAIMADRELTSRRDLLALGGMSWIRFEHFLRERHGRVPFPDPSAGKADGPRLFLAAVTSTNGSEAHERYFGKNDDE